MTDFIQANNRRLIITTNKVIVISDLNTIENYIKNIDIANSNEVISPRLLQSKSYLKILDIFYYIKDTDLSIISDVVEKVLHYTHIFNNVVLVS